MSTTLTQQTFQRFLNNIIFRLRRREVEQRQVNVETMLCTSTLKFTTLNKVEVESMLSISTLN